jgi:hypothetical protein
MNNSEIVKFLQEEFQRVKITCSGRGKNKTVTIAADNDEALQSVYGIILVDCLEILEGETILKFIQTTTKEVSSYVLADIRERTEKFFDPDYSEYLDC